MKPLYVREVGREGPVLLLIHGLGANGNVWDPLIEIVKDAWAGSIIVPDLRGHGRSPQGLHYGYGQHANDLAELVQPAQPVYVIGHSLGGVIGMVLASGWFGVNVRHVLGVGIKVNWSVDDLAKAGAMAQTPVRWFDTREEAVDRMLKISGLAGLVPPDSPIVEAGILNVDGRYRLALDPRTFSAPGPAFDAIVKTARAPFSLACGAKDKMVTVTELKAFDPGATVVPGLGHNIHVEAANVLWDMAQASMKIANNNG
jgi:pimeloyl-ACP methyl ester carboxylesterase